METMAGRKPRDEKRGPVDSTFTMRVHSEDRERWRAQAEREGKTLTEWLTELANQAVPRVTKKRR